MSYKTLYTKEQKELAREIYSRAIAVRIGAGDNVLNEQHAVHQSLDAAKAFFEHESVKADPVQVTPQHLADAAR